MKYIKVYEHKLKDLNYEQLNKVSIKSPFLEENKTDNSYYKISENANNWYYKIKYYYRVPGYKNYCFLTNEINPYYWQVSKIWAKEDELIKPSKDEIDEYLTKLNSIKYNL